MKQQSESGSSTSKVEGSSGGGSTSTSDGREGDRDSGASQDPNTKFDQVDGSEATTAGANEAADSEEDHTSEQGRSSLEAVSRGNADNQQTPEDRTVVNHEKSDAGIIEKVEACEGDDADTGVKGEACAQTEKNDADPVVKGEACAQTEKNDADPVGKEEACTQMKTTADTVESGEPSQQMEKNTVPFKPAQQQISLAYSSLHSDETTREKSLKNDPAMAKVGGTEGGCAADADEVDAQVRTQESYEAPIASSQDSQSSPAAVASPEVVVSGAQGARVLRKSKSVTETCNLPKQQPCSVRTKSLRRTPSDAESPPKVIVHPNSVRETSTGEETPSTGLVSGSQGESTSTSEAPSTASTAEPQVEVDMSQGDPESSVSASGAEEKSSEVPEPPSTVVLGSGPQKEAGLCVVSPSPVSRSGSRKQAFASPIAASKVSASGAQENSSEVSERLSTGVFDSGPQKGGGLCVEPPRTVSRSGSHREVFTSPERAGKMSGSEAQGGSSVVFGAPCLVLASGVVGVVPNSVVQEDVHPLSETLSTSQVKEDSVEKEALTTVSSCEVSKDAGRTSSDSPNTVQTPGEVRKFSSTNSAVRNEVSRSADPPSRISEGEISAVSKAPSTASASKAQKGTSPEEIVPRGPGSTEGGETSVPDGDTAVGDSFLTSTDVFRYVEQLAEKEEQLNQKDKTIAKLQKLVDNREALLNINKGKYQALKLNIDNFARENERLGRENEGLGRENEGLGRENEELGRENAELRKKCQDLHTAYIRKKSELEKYANAYAGMARTCQERDRAIRDLSGQLEQTRKECSTLQDQMSLYEQQHANEQSRGGSYLDDTKAATPALLVSSLNGVKDASNNFVKVLKSSIQSGIEPDALKELIGAVSRSGHTKFQYQAYICRVLFDGFEHPSTGVSKAVLPPTTYFRQYQHHDLKKTDTVDRLLRHDPEIDPSLHEFCFEKFQALMEDIQHLLIDQRVDLRQLVQNKQHPREVKLYVSFCKLAVSVWLLQRLAFSFLHPAKPFGAERGERFDLSRMQSVVPLDEPSADEEVQLKVGFYVLPGFDVGNSAIPCEVYVAMK